MVTIASTASEYPLANFQFRGPLAPKSKIACWGAGLHWRPQSVKRFEAPTEPTGETSPLVRNAVTQNSPGCLPCRAHFYTGLAPV